MESDEIRLSPLFLLPLHLLPIPCSAWKSHCRIKPHFLPQRLQPDMERSHMFPLTPHRRKQLSMVSTYLLTRATADLVCGSVLGLRTNCIGGSGPRAGRFQGIERNQTHWQMVSYPAVIMGLTSHEASVILTNS